MRGGMSLLLGDLLGNRLLFTAAEVSNRLRESAFTTTDLQQKGWRFGFDLRPGF